MKICQLAESEVKRYVPIDVWSRLTDGRLVRFRCFEILPGSRFCVQSADFFGRPTGPGRLSESDRQFLELFSEQPPDERSETFDTLMEAVEYHEKEFADL